MRQWSLIRFPQRSIYYWFHHGNDGRMSPFRSHIGYPFETNRAGRAYQGAKVESVEFKDGLRRLQRAVVAFQRSDGCSSQAARRDLATWCLTDLQLPANWSNTLGFVLIG